jgi:Class-II DAHP synthetase family
VGLRRPVAASGFAADLTLCLPVGRGAQIRAELAAFFDVHDELGTVPGGVHLEMTGDNVTECIGGGSNVSDLDLQDRYHTHCDPRLNAEQALEMAFYVASRLRQSECARLNLSVCRGASPPLFPDLGSVCCAAPRAERACLRPLENEVCFFCFCKEKSRLFLGKHQVRKRNLFDCQWSSRCTA